jgi:hypothetical protein
MPATPRELMASQFDVSAFDATEGGPCDVTPTRGLGGALDELTGGLSAGDTAMALLALSEHAGVLRLVWEAHVRGAITLPPTLARRVVQARRTVPPFLSSRESEREIGVEGAMAPGATVVVMPPSLGAR